MVVGQGVSREANSIFKQLLSESNFSLLETEAAWLNGDYLKKETIKKKKEKMKERLDTHRSSHGKDLARLL